MRSRPGRARIPRKPAVNTRRPTLTSVTTNFNHGRYLRGCIEAVLTQSRRPDQYLLVDDASTDESRAILEELRGSDPWVQIRLNERNLGLIANFKDLFERSTSDWFYSGAADDFIAPGFFEKAMEMAERYPHAGVIFGKVAFLHPSGKLKEVNGVRAWTESGYIPPGRFIPEYFDREIATHSLSAATIFRKQALLDQGGFRDELETWSDTFAIRSLALEHGGCYLPEIGATVRLSEQSVSGRVHRDPGRYMALIFRAAAVMRSSQFRALFPEEHVRSWLRRYRWRIVLSNVKRSLLAGSPVQAASHLRWLAYRPSAGA